MTKDYIRHPKPNGDRSLHLVLRVPIQLYHGIQMIPCEIQIRTTAMDSWASLEHNLRYKKGLPPNAERDKKLKLCADTLAKTDGMMQDIAEEMGIFNV